MKQDNFLLDGYICGKRTTVVLKSSKYVTQYYQGEHSDEYKIMEISKEKAMNKVELYKQGILAQSWYEENGCKRGDFHVYKQGRLFMTQSWENYLSEDDHIRVFHTKKGDRLEIVNRDTNHVVYKGECNKWRERHGYGIEYDSETGHEKWCGLFKKDVLYHIHQEFDEGIMIEYDEGKSSNSSIQTRVPCYSGEYLLDKDVERYIRHGVGYLIDPSTRKAKYECHYDHGRELRRIDLKKGHYCCDDTPVEEDTEEPAVNDSIIISSSLQCLDSMRDHLKELTVVSGFTNVSITEFRIISFPVLELIDVGDNCFTNVKTFFVDGLPNLEDVLIGNRSFVQKDSDFIEGDFHITNCGSLKVFQCGEYSFLDFIVFEMRSWLIELFLNRFTPSSISSHWII